MAAKFGRIDFMFLGPPLPGHWIRYCCSRAIVSKVHISDAYKLHKKTFPTFVDHLLVEDIINVIDISF